MKLLFNRVMTTFGPKSRPHGRSSGRRGRHKGGRRWRITRRGSVAWVTLLVLTAATFGGVAAWSNPFSYISQSSSPEFATTIVKRGPLEVTLTEPGQLESANNTVLRHKVEFGGGLTILKMVEEGTFVEKGQVLAELDTSRFVKNAQQQQIWTFVYDAGLKTAEARLVIQKLQNESLNATGEHQLKMAQLDLKKYLEAEHPQKRTKFLNAIQLAVETLETAQLGVEYDEKMIRKGYVTTDELKADRLSVTKAELALEIARERLHVFDEYTHKRELAQREANAFRFERELERVKLRNEHALSQRQLEVLYYRRWSSYFRNLYNNAMRQIEACVIRAPHEGVVVYANGGASSNANESVIYEGAKVWEGQAIIYLPDVTSMQVNARIHESKILLVREGQPVTIHVDACSGETFRGVVEKVALGPMTPAWLKNNLKEYATVIRVTDEPERVVLLKPGMTAEVTIHVDPLESVLQIPIQSCVDRGGRHFAWVVDEHNEIHRRELKVRTSSADAIEILDGLAEGETVVLSPRSDLPDEVAALGQEMLLAEEAAAAGAASTSTTSDGWPSFFDDDVPPVEPAGDTTAAPATIVPPPPPTGRLPEAGTKNSR
jgi:multidrug efflux pump subunit AcrA (membrane-fusion protein)